MCTCICVCVYVFCAPLLLPAYIHAYINYINIHTRTQIQPRTPGFEYLYLTKADYEKLPPGTVEAPFRIVPGIACSVC